MTREGAANNEAYLPSGNERGSDAGRTADKTYSQACVFLAEAAIAIGSDVQVDRLDRLDDNEESYDSGDREGGFDEEGIRPVRTLPGHEDTADGLSEQELVDAIKREGLEGPTWHALEVNLASYGLAVLIPWIWTAVIFKRCREQGLHLRRHSVRLTREDAEHLAVVSTARAIPTFQRRVLRDGLWGPVGEASLAAWFIGCCIHEFANVWKSWLAARQRDEDAGAEERDAKAKAVRELRDLLDQDMAAVVMLDIDGYDREKIAALLELPSPSVVEDHLNRFRRKLPNSDAEVLSLLRRLCEEIEKSAPIGGRR